MTHTLLLLLLVSFQLQQPLYGKVLYGKEKAPPPCLHRGCKLSPGLFPEDLNLHIRNLLSDPSYEDNLLRFVSWDVEEEKEGEGSSTLEEKREQFCKIISTTSPTIVGLQDMDIQQNEKFKPCLTQYTYAGRHPFNHNNNTKQHSLYVRKERRLRVVDTGSFSLDKNPNTDVIPRTCAWVRMRFAERKSARPLYFSSEGNSEGSYSRAFMKILGLLRAFTRSDNTLSNTVPSITKQDKVSYQWFDFYVAVAKLDPRVERNARHQLRTLVKRLKNHVLDRRRFPIILMADFGWEYNSSVFNPLKRSNWLENSFVTSFEQYPAVTLFNGNQGNEKNKDGSLVDFIYEDRFNSVLTATITSKDSKSPNVFRHRPVLSAVMRKKK